MREKTRVVVFFRVESRGNDEECFFLRCLCLSAFFAKRNTDQNNNHKRRDTIITLVYKYTITFLCPFAKSILYYDYDDSIHTTR